MTEAPQGLDGGQPPATPAPPPRTHGSRFASLLWGGGVVLLLAGVAENYVAASRRYGDRNARRIWRFTKRTQALARRLVGEHGIDCGLRWNGSDQIAGDDVEWREIEESARRLSSEEGVNVSVDPALDTLAKVPAGVQDLLKTLYKQQPKSG